VTPRDVPEFRGINQRGDGFAQSGEHAFQSGVKEQRLFVPDEEVIELHVKVRNVDAKPVKVGGNFIDGGHEASLARSIKNATMAMAFIRKLHSRQSFSLHDNDSSQIHEANGCPGKPSPPTSRVLLVRYSPLLTDLELFLVEMLQIDRA
jgi:hypothetical protein